MVTMPTGKSRRTLSIIGATAFGAGYLLSVIAGLFFPENGAIIAALVLLGLLVGAVNITSEEVVPYLVAAIALVLIGNTQAFTQLNLVVSGLGEQVNQVVRMMATFTAPAAVIQAVRAGMRLAAPGESTKS